MAGRQQTSKQPCTDTVQPVFRYQAAVLGTGEILNIVESIGRRQLRNIDPAGREGRRLLAEGQVHLWGDPLVPAGRMSLGDLFGRLLEQVGRDELRSAGDHRWRQSCAQRRESLNAWQRKYCDSPQAQH
jgi:hypothetical protein